MLHFLTKKSGIAQISCLLNSFNLPRSNVEYRACVFEYLLLTHEHMNTEIINYSQCWEDPDIMLAALKINSDDKVLSITSGGDNTLVLLIAGPLKVVSVDMNIAQNYLLELKIVAARSLPYNEYLEFLGVTRSKQRLVLFEKVHSRLSDEAAVWWSAHVSLLKSGPIQCGRFERFTNIFASYILPLVHSK